MNGKLRLRSNEFVRSNFELTSYAPANASGAYYLTKYPPNYTEIFGSKVFDGVLNESYAKLRGKLYKGNANLGVTFGEFATSRRMIISRYEQLNRRVDEIFNSLVSTKRRHYAKRVADAHLEIIFGWTPLLNDIIASATTVIQLSDKISWVRASARGHTSVSTLTLGNVLRTQAIAKFRCTRATKVQVSLSNLWLMERAGLLNPASVAWDLVPWSFVVNRFVNTGTLVNSITDFAGLSFPDGSTTRQITYAAQEVAFQKGAKEPYYGSSAFKQEYKNTVLGAVSRPPLTLKIPDANWELAAMAASLFTQKFTKLLTKMGPIPELPKTGRKLKYKWNHPSFDKN